MSWSDASSPLMWASLAIAVLTGFLGWYGWGRRREPGAGPFSIACGLATAWALASLMQSLATDPSTRILWYGAKTALLLPMVCAVTAFVLQFAGFGRYLTRSTVMWAFVAPSLVQAIIILTNPLHGTAWSDAVVDGTEVRVTVQLWGWIGIAYSVVLAILNIVVLLRLLVVSPRQRWPAGLMLVGHLMSRYAFVHQVLWLDAPFRLPPDAITVAVPFAIYAVALFGFHVFDPVPSARKAALDQMADGVLVVDGGGTVVDANPSAGRILGGTTAELRGRPVDELLALGPAHHDPPGEGVVDTFEITRGEGDGRRWYLVGGSTLTDNGGREIGRLYMLHDTTEQRGIQQRLLDREQAVARLTEREHLARDLHDGVGQVLGFVNMQTQAIRKRLADGESERADAMLARLAEVAQQAQGEVRELILSLKSIGAAPWASSLSASLTAQLHEFESQYGVRAQLDVVEGLRDEHVDPPTSLQVLRVVQEALSNARRHGDARSVRVVAERAGAVARILVEDDGRGFDPAKAEVDPARQFGLAIMRARMVEIGGSLQVESAPGRGTRVIMEVPINTQREGGI